MKLPTKIVAGTLAGALTIATGLIVKWEGTRYRAYPDPATGGAPWTICTGHTKGVKPGDVATPEQCAAYLKADELEAASAVAECIDVPLTENQLGALVSATFNLGPQVVCGSTLQRKANAGDIRGACMELDRWINAAGKPMRGLVLRRADERPVCWPDFTTVKGGSAWASQ